MEGKRDGVDTVTVDCRILKKKIQVLVKRKKQGKKALP
jgi:hypothetical protein